MYSIRETCAAETASAWKREASELSRNSADAYFFCCGLILHGTVWHMHGALDLFFRVCARRRLHVPASDRRGRSCLAAWRSFFAFGRGGCCMTLLRLGFGCMALADFVLALVVFVLALIKSDAWSTPPFAAFAI